MSMFRVRNLMVDVVSGARVRELEKTEVNQCLCTIHYTPITPTCWYGCSFHSPITPCQIGCSKFSPYERECPGPSVECAGSDLPIGCAGTDWAVIDLQKLVINPELIKEVQAELDKVLKAVAERSVETRAAMVPQTKAQAEVLETELQAALEEIQKLKGTLK